MRNADDMGLPPPIDTRHPQILLETYQRGDKLSDAELAILGGKMQSLADLSYGFGDMFRLQASYAQKVADDCRSFIKSRAERANKAS